MTAHASQHPSTSTVDPASPYDPWLDLRQNWPQVRVVIEPMSGDLLGEVRDGGDLIALRAGTSAAQRRCTLAHELVHLERGLHDCGPWSQREELQVHAEASRRLIPLASLTAAIRFLGGADDPAAIAQWLEVDRETLAVRLDRLGRAERGLLRRSLVRQTPLWSVA